MACKYHICEEGTSTLLQEKDPSHWKCPAAHFGILFDSDPSSVLKYGSNGLHFAEHILWNSINRRHEFMHSNAITFGTGEMGLYGICRGEDFGKGLTSFFDGLIQLTEKKLGKELRRVYRIEQMRVSAETADMHDDTRLADGPEGKMFTHNSDLLLSQFPQDYLWHILFEECSLRRILIIAHCPLTEEMVSTFRAKATELDARWKKVKLPKIPPLPKFFAPSISWFRSSPKPLPRTLSMDAITNPIDKYIVAASCDIHQGMYFMKITVEMELEKRDEWMPMTLDTEDQYYFSPILLSATPGVSIAEEWLIDLDKPEELDGKYSGKRLADAIKLLRSGRSDRSGRSVRV